MTVVEIVVVVVALAVLAAGWVTVRTFNRLVRLRNQTGASWAQIDVQLKRRHDLVPNLVETVGRYAEHERETLEAVAAARSAAVARGATTAERVTAENTLTRVLGNLFAVAEANPDLRANQGFLKLQSELTGTEDKIAYARQFYNSAVQTYNTAQETFPGNVIAGLGGHGPREYFEVEAEGRTPVQVRFR
jgi:LemA protein